jgi:hypothetical protein
LPSQKSAEARTRSGADGEKPKRAIVSGIDVILALAHKLEASFDLVPATGVDRVVLELALSRMEDTWTRLRKSKARRTVASDDIQFHQSGLLNVSAGCQAPG